MLSFHDRWHCRTTSNKEPWHRVHGLNPIHVTTDVRCGLHGVQCTRAHVASWIASLVRMFGAVSKLPVASPMSQFILQPFRHFTYVTAHSPTLPLLHLRHSSFSNPSFAAHISFSKLSVASPMSQLILQPFSHFTYVTAHSSTLLLLLLRHRLFTYVTWRAAHVVHNGNLKRFILVVHAVHLKET